MLGDLRGNRNELSFGSKQRLFSEEGCWSLEVAVTYMGCGGGWEDRKWPSQKRKTQGEGQKQESA